MFEVLFHYSPAVFSKGDFVFLSGWPVWLLGAAVAAAAGLLALPLMRGSGPSRVRRASLWAIDSALAGLILLLVWQPALSVATLKPQQNVVAVVVDDSRSMAIAEGGETRAAQARRTLESGSLEALRRKFQVRLYRGGPSLERIDGLGRLSASGGATRLSANLKEIAAESAGLPIGAVILVSDGGDNSGGIGRQVIDELRRNRIPVHTVGLGRERAERDLEISEVEAPARAMADSRLGAVVTLRQAGFTGSKARLSARENGKVLASREITLKEGPRQVERLVFDAGLAGAKTVEFAVEPLEGEESAANNRVSRLVNVEAVRPRVLYLEGEPRWEFKFIRRAAEEDRNLRLVTMLRTTQNKIYRQGIDNPKELELGFPSTADELFAFQGLVIGSVEAGYFTPAQQELIRQFVDRRGGGLLFLAGRAALGEGQVGGSVLAELLPVILSGRKGTFHRERAAAELTESGADSLICRLEEDPARNAARWRKLPYLADYQETGTPKPGAVVLAELLPSAGGRLPLLVTENYGRGRTALLATSGSWRWQMAQELSDRTHEMFWQQLLRWLVEGAPGRVSASTPVQVLADESRLKLRAEIRDSAYAPVSDSTVEARILGPAGASGSVSLAPDPLEPGVYTGEWEAGKPGSYLAEVLARRGDKEEGRDVVVFRREDGVAENFRTEQNRALLEKLAAETGGRYWRPHDLGRLAEEVSYSEAGISVREIKELWKLPAVFLLLLGLRAGGWLLRRHWGAV